MTIFLQLLSKYYQQIMIGLGMLGAYVLVRNNKALEIENKEVKKESEGKDGTIKLQQDIIKEVKKVKTVNIAGTVKRMRDNEL